MFAAVQYLVLLRVCAFLLQCTQLREPFVQNLGVDWDERVLPSIGSEVVKAVVAQYNAESLLTKREEVSAAVSHSLRARAKDFNIILDDVSITHLSFSQEFTKAVESKQVAEQDAQRAQFVVMKAEQVPQPPACRMYTVVLSLLLQPT